MRAAADEIAPQHEDVHKLLTRWGLWVRTGRGSSGLASIESLYSRGGGTPPATAPLSADPMLIAVERAVLRVPEQHRKTLRLLYVQRYSATTICQAVHLRYEDFGRWVFTARAMVVNLMRRNA